MRREAAMRAELRVRMRRDGPRTRNLSFSRALTQKKICFFVVVRGEMEKRTTTRHMKVTEARVHMRKEAAMRAELRVRMRKDGDVRVHTSG